MKPCPLVFTPIFKPRIWGGRRLESLLGKSLPPDAVIGESWEVADLEDDQTVVSRGPAAGKTLGELVRLWGRDLLGAASLFEGRFPLLIKYLDACQDLSVQVHPDAAMAQRQGGSVRVKNEAWYVLAAEPDSCIYRGLHAGVTEESFRRAIADGTCAELLTRIPVRVGECYYLPSGTVHALGAGVVVAEVQTPSDVTYRLFDWNRVDAATGQPRALHVDDGLACIHFGDQRIAGEERTHVASVWTTVTRLVTSPSFIVERVRMIDGYDGDIPYAQLVIWMVLEGAGEVTFADGRERLTFGRGDTVVLPAGLADSRLKTLADCLWLEITLPQ
ncbi:MAG TPA: class I mannose-6-phosphate isomerase [Phycisphaerae bacterium]|nr:class I mannose-6-phosphate isomerase [Phycisphaerales bacterium]HRX83903.1 class I mannose-6-phosphate isomerase [Phycisphaerae bacterium]